MVTLIGNPRIGDTNTENFFVRVSDRIADRFIVQSLLGSGTFGQVVEAYDFIRREKVAIKIIRDRQDFRALAANEIKVLQRLTQMDPDDENLVVKVKNFFAWKGRTCIVFELLSHSLFELLKRVDFKGVSLTLTRKIGFYIANALQFLKRAGIVHCDLKPENIAFCDPKRSKIKLIDFGSALMTGGYQFKYVQSRFYRSPEVLLGYTYNAAIDIWSFGCILFELYTGKALFQSKTEYEHMACIVEVLGIPPAHILKASSRTAKFFKLRPDGSYCLLGREAQYPSFPGSKSLANLIGANTGGPYGLRMMINAPSREDYRMFLDLLNRTLEYDPARRITPSEVLQHPFIAKAWVSTRSPPPTEHRTDAVCRRSAFNPPQPTNPFSFNNNSYHSSSSSGSGSTVEHKYSSFKQVYPWSSIYSQHHHAGCHNGQDKTAMHPSMFIPERYTHAIIPNTHF